MADLSHNKPGPGYLGRIGICTHTKREEGGERREEGGGRGEGGWGKNIRQTWKITMLVLYKTKLSIGPSEQKIEGPTHY